MSYGPIRAALALLVLCGVGLTWLAISRPIVRSGVPASSSPTLAAAARAAGSVLDDEAVERAVGRALFRADRRSPAKGYDPERAQMPEVPIATSAPKPALAVAGIVWGDEPAAVVEGLPGRERSVVLRVGESAGGFKIVGIRDSRVVIRGMDTTWRLTVRESW